jgi:hypothetical protein
VIEALAPARIVAGVSLGDDFAGRERELLVCATETKRGDDIEAFATALEAALA